MKKSKKNYVIIALVVILLCLAIGYAAFTANLTINGTATGTGTWDVKFTSATINETGHGDAPTVTDTTITVDAKLAYPGDGCTVTANILNNGNIPAKLTEFKLTDDQGNTYSNENVEVTIPTIATDGSEVIATGKTCPVTFAIKWKEDSTATTVNAKFKISFKYEPDTSEVTVTPSHGVHQ